MKKTLKVSAVVLVLLVACTLSVSAGGKEESYTIGMECARLTVDTFAQFARVFEAYCDERGWRFVSNESQEDTAILVTNIENMITAGCDAIFSHNIDPAATKDIYQRVKDAGIVLVCYDAPSDVADYNFSVDNHVLGYEVGKMAGEWANENLGGKAKAVCYVVPFLDFLVKRSEGNVAGLTETCPTCELLDVMDINMEIAADVVENAWQAYPDVNIMIFPGDYDAHIAYEILQAEIDRKGLNPDNYGLFACDGSASVLPIIAADTIYRGTIDLGLKYEVPTAAMEAIEYSLTGKGKKYPRDNFYPMNHITAENAAEYIEK